jgi:hypothetical protein
MPPIFNEALEWLHRAEQSREVAGQLTKPGAKRAMLQAAKGYERLARAAAERALRRQREENEARAGDGPLS